MICHELLTLLIIVTELVGFRLFPDGPVVKTPCFQCRGHGFDPWSGKFHVPLYAAKIIFFN